MSLLFSYHDIDIYESDAKLFQGRKWLNDSCISLAFKLLAERIITNDDASSSSSSNMKKRILLFLNPMIVSFIRLQLDTQEEFEEFAASHNLYDHDWLLLPLNDSLSFEQPSTHWSLLLYHIPTGESLHFDPSAKYNSKSASHFVQTLHEFLPRTSLQVIEVTCCPQQSNSYDCGIYTILFAESLANYLQHNNNRNDDNNYISLLDTLKSADWLEVFRDVNLRTAIDCRQELRNTVDQLHSSKKKRL